MCTHIFGPCCKHARQPKPDNDCRSSPTVDGEGRSAALTGLCWLVLQLVRRRAGTLVARPLVKQSLRKTPTQLHLAYKYGEDSDRLVGRHLALLHDGPVLTISIDLASNFQGRNKTAAAYLDAVHLLHNHHRLRSLQCGDNLVRSRLIRAWDQVAQPQLRMCLELGSRGRFLYSVKPHSLFAGGIQLDVADLLEEDVLASRLLPPQQIDDQRNHP